MPEKKLSKSRREILDRMPSQAVVEEIATDALRRRGMDAQLAPLFAANMRFTFSKVQEIKYPEYQFVNGEVLEEDSIDPAADEWEYYTVDGAGAAYWIGDDGETVSANAVQVTRKTGKSFEMGHSYDVTIFDQERYAAQGRLGPVVIPVMQTKEKIARKSHDAKTDWVWAMGDSGKQLPGLLTHPNVIRTLAPTKATGGLRVWDANATNDEILTDIATAINTVATSTSEQYHAKKVYLSHADMRLLRDRRLGAGDGFASLLDLVKDRYAGDPETGQGKVTFHTLRYATAAYRTNPETGSDDSGISGAFILVLPDAPKDELSFVRARKYTQRPPEDRNMKTYHHSHSKIGGCKMQVPLAVHMFHFA